MTTKNILSVLLLASVCLLGCKKYEEGPGLSFRSKEARLANTWKVVSCNVDGTDYTSFYTNINYTETYDESGNYSYSSNSGSGTGKWQFQSDKEEIYRSAVAGQPTRTLTILKLKDKEFWYYFKDGSSKYEFHLEEK